MKKFLLFTVFFVLFTALFAQNLGVLMDYKSYYTTTGDPYLEISSFVSGKSVKYKLDEENAYQAEVRITLQAFQGEELVNALDYILTSEQFGDSISETKPNFGDINNFPLPNGEYLLQFSVQDMNSEAKPLFFADIYSIDYPQNEVSISDISLYKSVSRETTGDIFDKYGFSLDPLFYGFVPETMVNLPFSCEIYNTDQIAGEEQITIKSYITCFENSLMPYPEARHTAVLKAKPVMVHFGEIGIFKLPSGNYNLMIEVYNKDSELLSSNSYFFQRSNPNITFEISDFNAVDVSNTFVDNIKDSAQILEYVRFLYPISTPMEREFYRARMGLIPVESLKKFFYAFWVKRDPYNPEKAWNEYLEKVKHVDRLFGCKLVQGYRSDRGRVYLQYGAPNSIYEAPYDSHSFPYEIWHYYHCIDQSNVKFVFYNTDLVSNDYELLHSDKRGELQDPFWMMKLTERKSPTWNFDDRVPEDYYGGNPKYDWREHR